MEKTIKTKEVVKDIKTVDKKKNLEHFEKKENISNKELLAKNNNESNKNSHHNNYAVNKTITVEKRTAIDAGIRGRELLKRKNKIKVMKSQNKIKKDISQRKPNIFNNKKDISTKPANSIMENKKGIKSKESLDLRNNSPHQYHKKMHMQMLNRYKAKVIEFKKSKPAKFFNGTIGAVKKTVKSVNNIVMMGTGLIVLIVIILFIGVFSALSDDSSVDTSSMYVSEEVLAYTETIKKYAKESEIEDYVALIQAVMMQESGGKGSDPMQSSECGYNEKYPKQPNGITDPDYSIKVGIQYLADCLKKAEVKDPSDTNHISLALQGYNYGNGYIQWAVEHFGGYTRANAKVFSDEKKAELQVKVYGDPEYVTHVLRYYHIGKGNIVLVAKSQIGNVGGKKYWTWYGFRSKVNWCAIFVSYCANESGDLNKTIPKFSSVYEGEMWFKHHSKWKRKNYIPNSGDIIFFDWEQNGGADHVGIVEKVENGRIYTIEGNSSDEVKVKSYSVDYRCIYGYGINLND